MARPIIKWVGGKTQLLPEILKRIPGKFKTYYEPFVGGGAVFFALAAEGRFKEAVLNDRNPELVELYRGVRDHCEDVISLLSSYTYSKDKFMELREQDPKKLTQVERAARFIYLNKTCFNGLYRVNKSGKFNVPFGKFSKPPTICDQDNIRAASKALKCVTISHEDFASIALNAEQGDVVYFDPPYVPLNATSSFTSYASDGFGMKDQNRLVDTVKSVVQNGAYVLLSNSDCPITRELYQDFQIDTVMARRSVNRDASKRGSISEILVSAPLQPRSCLVCDAEKVIAVGTGPQTRFIDCPACVGIRRQDVSDWELECISSLCCHIADIRWL